MLRLGSRAAALFLLIFLFAPRPAAACDKIRQTVYQLFETATHVVEVRVLTVPIRSGHARFHVLRTLKGSKRRFLRGSEYGHSCRIGYRVARRALVFLGPNGRSLDGYYEFRREPELRAATLTYAAARDDAARLAALIDAIVAGPPRVRDEAAYFLADRPDLLARIGPPERTRLLAAHAADVRDEPLLVVFARIGADFSAPPTSSSPHYHELATILRTRDELEQEDTAALADRLERGQTAYDPQLIRAMDRCERLRGRALHSIHMYGARGHTNHWPTLAAACRTGQPADH